MLAFLRGIFNVLRLPLWPLWWVGRLVGRPRGSWVVVRLQGRLTELPRPRPRLARLVPGLARRLPTPLESLRRMAEHLSRDARMRGAVVVIPPLQAGWSSCKAVRDALLELRARGKEVVTYLPGGGGNRELYVASAGDRTYVGPRTSLATLGLSLESRYFKPLLDRLGIEVEAFARGEYKTAAEPATRESMSEPQRRQLGQLLAALDHELVSALASRPGMDEGRVRALFERGFVHGSEAVEAGIADGVAYEDELPTRLGEPDAPATLVRASRYYAFKEARFFKRLLPARHIGVVAVRGPIVDQPPSVPTGSQGSAELEPVVQALRAARRDRRVAGVVLHVDSPGGSAMASDRIHREVQRLAERKPVVAALGNVAASGGYYVAAGAHAIVAQPTTITGSIGVVSARVLARGLLDRMGVRTETLRTAPHADMFSVARVLDDDERSLVERELEAVYWGFVDVVAQGRGQSREQIDAIARGRVWAGADALEQGLVDRLGGFEIAVEEARRRVPERRARGEPLRPKAITPRKLDLPPPEPEGSKRSPWMQALPEEAWELLGLVSGPERLLCYAPLLPRVR